MTRTQRLWLTVGPAALVFGLVVLWLSVTSDHMTQQAVIVVLTLAVGWSFIASGLVAWGRRPENRTGPLMVLVGFTWFITGVSATNSPWPFTLSILFGDLFLAIFVHLLVAYPSGRLEGRFEKVVVWSAYIGAISARVTLALIKQKPYCDGCPRDTLAFWGSDAIASALTLVFDLIGVAIMIATVVILARRRRAASAAARRVLDPVLITGTITLVFVGLGFALEPVSKTASSLSYFMGIVAFVAVPLFFLAGLLRFRLARAAAGELLQEVSETPSLEEAQDGLRRALHDPTLELAWWVPESAGYVDQEGHPFTPVETPGRAITPVRHEGQPLAVVVHDAALLDEPELLNGVLAAARLALVKDRLQAELLARLVELERERDFIATVVNAAPTFFCVTDMDGRIVRFNDTLIATSGTPDDGAVRGRPFWEVFVVPEDREGVRAAFLPVAPGEHEHRWRAVDGEVIVAWSLTRLADAQGRERLMVTGLDVSERARHEEELQRQRDFLSIVGDQTPGLLCVVDSSGTIFENGVNHAFRAATGRHDATAIGHPFWEVAAAPELAETVRAAFLEAVEAGPGMRTETPWRSASGEPLLVEWWVSSLDDWREEHFLIVGMDITERKEQELELRRSRARIVEAGAAERRRLERNLHDGAQQRLVSLSLALRLAQAKIATNPDTAAQILGQASGELALALEELRELARGIHPAVLTDRGLTAALETLAARAPLPVELQTPTERLAPPVEAAAYYVVAEALTNVVKYAQASAVNVTVEQHDGHVVVEVADDGVGGAEPAAGSGLSGLADRVAALDGTLRVESPAGGWNGRERADPARGAAGRTRRSGLAPSRTQAGPIPAAGRVCERAGMASTHKETEMKRELAHRSNNGIEVTLYWLDGTDRLAVAVADTGSGDSFELPVESRVALDAFHHPYAYAAFTGVEYRTGERAPVYA